MSDLISRQAAIDAFKKICNRCGEYKKNNGVMCGACYLDDGISIVEDLPSAQPEQSEEDCDTCKHGYFGDSQCDNCRVGYPSHYEREDDGVDC